MLQDGKNHRITFVQGVDVAHRPCQAFTSVSRHRTQHPHILLKRWCIPLRRLCVIPVLQSSTVPKIASFVGHVQPGNGVGVFEGRRCFTSNGMHPMLNLPNPIASLIQPRGTSGIHLRVVLPAFARGELSGRPPHCQLGHRVLTEINAPLASSCNIPVDAALLQFGEVPHIAHARDGAHRFGRLSTSRLRSVRLAKHRALAVRVRMHRLRDDRLALVGDYHSRVVALREPFRRCRRDSAFGVREVALRAPVRLAERLAPFGLRLSLRGLQTRLGSSSVAVFCKFRWVFPRSRRKSPRSIRGRPRKPFHDRM